MSETIAHAGTHAHTEAHRHPTDRSYVIIAAILAAITAAEVTVSYTDIGSAFVPTLVVMMTAKFTIVGAYFMHLKFDSFLFTRVFVAGIVLAIGVYLIAITTFGIFGS